MSGSTPKDPTDGAVERFVRDAIEGGWKPASHFKELSSVSGDVIYYYGVDNLSYDMRLPSILLDKDAWIAVCKTRDLVSDESLWRSYMHEFIEYLAEGCTIESALSQIE